MTACDNHSICDLDEVTRSAFSKSKKDDEDEDDDSGDEDDMGIHNEEGGGGGAQVEKAVGRDHSAMDLLRKYGMHDDVQEIIEMRKTKPKTRLTTVKPFVNIKPAVTSGHGHVITENEIIKEGERKKRFPKAIIAGVKKGGTRALLSFLGKHPLVQSGGKEMHFFDKDSNYAQGVDYYLSQMPLSYANEITIEKTPGYFVKSYVPKRIYQLDKTMKLIFILRDPVERAISDYAQALSKEKAEQKPFERLIFKKPKKGSFGSLRREINSKSSKVSIGMYYEHVQNWLEYFPLKQMYFVNGDEFIRNPVPEITAVQKFLDLPVLINKRSFYFNNTKGFYCIIVKREINGEISSNCLGETKGRKHPKIKASSLERLRDFYKPYNRKLFKLIRKDFSWPVDRLT